MRAPLDLTTLSRFCATADGMVAQGQMTHEEVAGVLRAAADSYAPPQQLHGPTQAHEAAAHIRRVTGVESHPVAAVLGSGYASLLDNVPGVTRYPLREVPHMPVPGVNGHGTDFLSVPVLGKRALVFGGRVHAYEGYDFDAITFAVRTAILTGAKIVFLTNAAGGVEHPPGSLVFIRDHMVHSPLPLFPSHHPEFGSRFFDPNHLWDATLTSALIAAAETQDLSIGTGRYSWEHGPTYETVHYVRTMWFVFGIHMFGMSTVPEGLAAKAMGARVVAVSTLSNWAGGVNPQDWPIPGTEWSTTPIDEQSLSHAEVADALAQARPQVRQLLDIGLPILMEAATA